MDTTRPPKSKSAGASSGTTNVLVVDDEAPIRELVAYVLENHGYRVFRARHSGDALRLHSGFIGTFHLLFTDICMLPHDDGFALARTLRRNRPDLRVIFSSGFVEPDRLRTEVRESGALFLPKPFTPSDILDCVRRSLAVSAAA